MITLAKCRELLGETSKGLADDQILALREQLYALADVITDMYIEQHEKSKSENAKDGVRPEWN